MSAKNMIYDVVVVGGGPVGSIAARYAAQNDANVLLLEEHASIGTPVQCTGLLSTRALEECGIAPMNDFVYNSVRGAFVYSPAGVCLPIDGGRTKAYVVSRKIFDRKLVSLAADRGVNILLRAKVVGLTTSNTIQKLDVIQLGRRITICAKVVIAADGVKSQVAHYAGLGRVKRILSGMQIEAPYSSPDPDFVELFPGSPAPGFFAWTVPLSADISRIGVAVEPGSKHLACEYLERLIRQNGHIHKRMGTGELDLVTGGIPIGPLEQTYTTGVLIAGDAAGQVKPTSGGGIYTGAVCARIAGEVAASAALKNDVSARYLKRYQERWKAAIGKELAIGMRIHDITGRMSDTKLSSLIDSMNDPAVLKMITEYGDMDRPSILIKKMLDPRNSRIFIPIARTFTKALL